MDRESALLKIEEIEESGSLDILREILGITEGVCCAGGAVRSVLYDRHLNDYDLYFMDDRALSAVVSYLVTNGGDILKNDNYVTQVKYCGSFFHLVYKQYFMGMDLVYQDFDFHNICASLHYNFDGWNICCSDKFFESNDDDIVMIKVISKPLQSMIRLGKYYCENCQTNDAYDYILALLDQHKRDYGTIVSGQYYG